MDWKSIFGGPLDSHEQGTEPCCPFLGRGVDEQAIAQFEGTA